MILYLGRSQPVRTLDEIMLELQTVETFNVIIERTETPPYYRLDVLSVSLLSVCLCLLLSLFLAF